MAARRIERALDHEVVVEPQARIAESVTVAREALLRCRVGKGSVRDAGDRHMAQADEVLDRLAGAGPIVDVHARRIQVGARALEDDREALADELREILVVGPRTGDDEPIGAPRKEQVGVRAVARGERLDEDPVATRAGRRREAVKGLRQQGVGSYLGSGLAEHQPEGQALPTGKLSGRAVGVVVERASRLFDPPPGRRGNLHACPSVQNEGNSGSRHAGPRGDVRAGGTPSLLSHMNSDRDGRRPGSGLRRKRDRAAVPRAAQGRRGMRERPASSQVTRVSNAHYPDPSRAVKRPRAGLPTASRRAS